MSKDSGLAGRYPIATRKDRFPVADRQVNCTQGLATILAPCSHTVPQQILPPFSQITTSSLAAGFSDGKNQNQSPFGSLEFEVMGNTPAYDSPMLKSTSGIALPLTANSARVSFSQGVR